MQPAVYEPIDSVIADPAAAESRRHDPLIMKTSMIRRIKFGNLAILIVRGSLCG